MNAHGLSCVSFSGFPDPAPVSAAFSAALAHVAARRAMSTCVCGLEAVISAATSWASCNAEAFEKAMVEMEMRTEAAKEEKGGTAADDREKVQGCGRSRSHEVNIWF